MDIQTTLRQHKEKIVIAGLAIPLLIIFNFVNLESKFWDMIRWKWILLAITGLAAYVFYEYYYNRRTRRSPRPQETYRTPPRPQPRPRPNPEPTTTTEKQTPIKPSILDQWEEMKQQ